MNIGFIGGGNMAAAIIGGLRRSGHPVASLRVADIDAGARERIAREHGVQVFDSPAPVAQASDVLLLAVKPQHVAELAPVLRPLVPGRLLVSICAGLRTADLSRWLGGHDRIIRAMPNTPALVGCGIAGLFAMPGVGADDRATAAALLDAVGESLWVGKETDLDAVTAVSGSGPAYVFYFIEALERAGVGLGLSGDTARRLAIATFGGAAKLAAAGGDDPATLRVKVTSKGGTTEAALRTMEQEDVAGRIVAGVRAAAVRSAELGDALGGAR